MARAAVLKKADMKSMKKTSAKQTLKMAKGSKTTLKVVKNNARPQPAKKTAAKVAAKKPAPKLATKKPVKAVAKAAAVKKVTATVKPKTPTKAPVKMRMPLQQRKPAPVASAPKMAAPQKKEVARTTPSAKAEFKVGNHVVYPTHGVGKIIAEETQMIGEVSLRMLVIAFEKDRMTLRVPVARASAAGLRHISGNDQMQKVFVTLKGKAKVSRGMWSRRAQEYEAKINSGNILSIAEVVRDLHHNVDQTERSYSERMIYESALGRLVGELAAAEGTDHKNATDKLMKLLRSKAA